MKLNLDTIILYVQNVEKLKLFYTGILKLAIVEEYPPLWVLLNAGNGQVGLHKIGEPYWDKSKGGFKFNNNTKIVFEIDEDIDQVREHLLGQAVFMKEIKTFDNYDYWLCDGEDPEGNVFQLKQKKEIAGTYTQELINYLQMDFKKNLDNFQKAADKLDKTLLAKKQLEAAVGIYQDCVFLKLYKKSWANPLQDPLTAETRIFFSVWINNAPGEQKLLYNIHALKLRKLKGYSIESRKFADTFRASFRPSAHKWKNVSVKFGPLTLMQGWVVIDREHLQDHILELANNFLEIDYLIDNTLATFKQ